MLHVLANKSVKIANGSFTIVASVGSIKLSRTLCLFDVIHVLGLTCNLLSISKFTVVLPCFVNFNSNFCVFQDQTSG